MGQNNSPANGADLEHLTRIPQQVLERLAISENGFVFDPATGNSYMCNDTALQLLRAMQHCASADEVMQTIQQHYDIEKRDLERDLLEFSGQLREHLGL